MTRFILIIVGVLIVPRVSAQEASGLQGSWRACFALTAPAQDAPRLVCGQVSLPSGAACGSPIVHFAIPVDSLRPPLPYNGGDVQLTLTDSTLSFGGRLELEAAAD